MIYVLEFAIAIAVVSAILPLVEYLSHRLVMHHPTKVAPDIFDRHAVQHHRLGRHDINIDLEWWWALLLASPGLIVLVACRLYVATGTLAMIAVFYALLWTGLHRSIHGLGGRWTTRLPGYSALRSHHLRHHARPGRNFGTVFGPLLDRPLGTWAKE